MNKFLIPALLLALVSCGGKADPNHTSADTRNQRTNTPNTPTTRPNSLAILSATQSSGYTTAEQAFEYHCELSEGGTLTGYLRNDHSGSSWGTDIAISKVFTPAELDEINTWIEGAKSGNLSQEGILCDAGSTDITARVLNSASSFIVVNALDCSMIRVNQGPTVQKLLQFLKKECKIEYGNQE